MLCPFNLESNFSPTHRDRGREDTDLATINHLNVQTRSAINDYRIVSTNDIEAPKFVGDLDGTADDSLHAILADSAISFSGDLSGDILGGMTTTQIAPGVIVNADINSSAGIVDTKLATLTTSEKVANSATTATSSNTDGTIVLRNNTSGTSLGLTNFEGNVYLKKLSGDNYRDFYR